jgi:hypothetical protein
MMALPAFIALLFAFPNLEFHNEDRRRRIKSKGLILCRQAAGLVPSTIAAGFICKMEEFEST